MPLDRITLFCFGASYTVASGLELYHLFRPRAVLRLIALGFVIAGVLAHTLYLLTQRPPLASQYGSMLVLAWVVAIFCLYGTLHHRRIAWSVFVLPLVIGLVCLAWATPHALAPTHEDFDPDERLWRLAHAGLLVLASVGVSVGFLASVMYLAQARRLRTKAPPGGMKLLSLERLEEMNRRAINLAFPFLTAGLLVGLFMKTSTDTSLGWSDPKVVAAALLWCVFLLLLYLRYGQHLSGRRLAQLTILVFTLMLFTMTWPHFGPGGAP